MTELSFTYEAEEPGRLDQFLLEKLSSRSDHASLTRSRLKHWIENGRVTLNGSPVSKAGTILKRGYVVRVTPEEPARSALSPFELDLRILHEDEHMVVVDKPADLTMHPGAGNRDRTLANALIAHFGASQAAFPDTSRPGIVHRLDKDTSGVVVVARNVAALNALGLQFASRTVDRRYLALVFSTPRARREVNVHDEGVIETSIGRHPSRRVEMAVLAEGGRRAVTRWRVLERVPYACLLDVKLDTGRTHQIRVHMRHMGSPVIGDPVYGEVSGLPQQLRMAAERFGRQALHAYRLEIAHPVSGERMSFESPPPSDMLDLMRAFGARFRG